jgi:hypothetical protein
MAECLGRVMGFLCGGERRTLSYLSGILLIDIAS